MLNVNNLKLGDRVQFAPNTFAQVTNYEIDVSHLKGTITHIDFDECIHLKTDLKLSDFEEWDYEIYFDLTSDRSYGGTDKYYLSKAKLLEEVK